MGIDSGGPDSANEHSSCRRPMNDGNSREDYVEAGYAGVEVGNATEEGDAGKRGKS
jgi:hypothetical protein